MMIPPATVLVLLCRHRALIEHRIIHGSKGEIAEARREWKAINSAITNLALSVPPVAEAERREAA